MSDPALKAFDSFVRNARNPAPQRAEPEEEVNLQCWGFVRGNRRAFNVELRRLKGTWPALEYTWLPNPIWCPAPATIGGLTVPAASIVLRYTTGHVVAVSGRNLREPYDKLREHQVMYFAEVDDASQLLATDDDVIVSRIQIIEPKLDAE